ncbi:MAG: hypothetical protein CMO44_12185, partial [Verrucomicrobiales bacterium]|nr:hypothetical protein [Verrucomicrobiales bacterium]
MTYLSKVVALATLGFGLASASSPVQVGDTEIPLDVDDQIQNTFLQSGSVVKHDTDSKFTLTLKGKGGTSGEYRNGMNAECIFSEDGSNINAASHKIQVNGGQVEDLTTGPKTVSMIEVPASTGADLVSTNTIEFVTDSNHLGDMKVKMVCTMIGAETSQVVNNFGGSNVQDDYLQLVHKYEKTIDLSTRNWVVVQDNGADIRKNSANVLDCHAGGSDDTTLSADMKVVYENQDLDVPPSDPSDPSDTTPYVHFVDGTTPAGKFSLSASLKPLTEFEEWGAANIHAQDLEETSSHSAAVVNRRIRHTYENNALLFNIGVNNAHKDYLAVDSSCAGGYCTGHIEFILNSEDGTKLSTSGETDWCADSTGLFDGLSALSKKADLGMIASSKSAGDIWQLPGTASSAGVGNALDYSVAFTKPTVDKAGYTDISGTGCSTETLLLKDFASIADLEAKFNEKLAACQFAAPGDAFYDDNITPSFLSKQAYEGAKFRFDTSNWVLDIDATSDNVEDLDVLYNGNPPIGDVTLTCDIDVDAGSDAKADLQTELDNKQCSGAAGSQPVFTLNYQDIEKVEDETASTFLGPGGSTPPVVRCEDQSISITANVTMVANDMDETHKLSTASFSSSATQHSLNAWTQLYPTDGGELVEQTDAATGLFAAKSEDVSVTIDNVVYTKSQSFDCVANCNKQTDHSYNCDKDKSDASVKSVTYRYEHPTICDNDSKVPLEVSQKVHVALANPELGITFKPVVDDVVVEDIGEKELYDLSKNSGVPLRFTFDKNIHDVAKASKRIRLKNGDNTGSAGSYSDWVDCLRADTCDVNYKNENLDDLGDLNDSAHSQTVEYEVEYTFGQEGSCGSETASSSERTGVLTVTPDNNAYKGEVSITYLGSDGSSNVNIDSSDPCDENGVCDTHPATQVVMPSNGLGFPTPADPTGTYLGVKFTYDPELTYADANTEYDYTIDFPNDLVYSCTGINACQEDKTSITLSLKDGQSVDKYFKIHAAHDCSDQGQQTGENAFTDETIDFTVRRGGAARTYKLQMNCATQAYNIVVGGDNMSESAGFNELTSLKTGVRNKFNSQQFKVGQYCPNGCATQIFNFVPVSGVSAQGSITIPNQAYDGADSAKHALLNIETTSACTGYASFKLENSQQSYTFRTKCVRYGNIADSGVVTSDIHLDYGFSMTFGIAERAQLSLSGNPNGAGVSMETKIGGSCGPSNDISGGLCDTTVLTAQQDIDTFLDNVYNCNGNQDSDSATQFEREFSIVRSYHDTRNGNDIKYCESRSVSVALYKAGSANATIAVNNIDGVDFFVAIDELEWVSCDSGSGADSGYKVVMKLSADRQVGSGSRVDHSLASYAPSGLASGDDGSYGDASVQGDLIVVEGTCHANTLQCANDNNGDGVANDSLQKSLDFNLHYTDSASNEYASEVSITTQITGCPVLDENEAAHVASTIVVKKNNNTITGNDLLSIESNDVLSFSLDDSAHNLDTDIVSATVDGNNFCDLDSTEYSQSACVNSKPTDEFSFNAAPLAGETFDVVINYEYTLDGARRRRLLRVSKEEGSSSVHLAVLPASMELNDKMEGSADEAVSTDSDVNVWMIV